MLEALDSDYERGQYLQNILIAESTGHGGDPGDYHELRRYFVDRVEFNQRLPGFVKTNRDLPQFWQFIKYKFSTYAARREYIYSEFGPFFDFIEGRTSAPADAAISDTLRRFSEDGVHQVWSRALERKEADPEGAITAARTLIESVCKHILDNCNIQYNSKKIEIHELYKMTAEELNLSPSQHTEDVFKQILGGCSAVVNGLGTLRNRLGDAHGQGQKPVRPVARHAELAVNLSGSLALYLVATYEAQENAET